MREDQPVVEKVEVMPPAIGEVGLQYDEGGTWAQDPVHFGETGSHLFATLEMLVNVAGKDRIYRSRRQHRKVRTRAHDDAYLLLRIAPQVLCIDVKGDFL